MGEKERGRLEPICPASAAHTQAFVTAAARWFIFIFFIEEYPSPQEQRETAASSWEVLQFILPWGDLFSTQVIQPVRISN